MITAGIAYLTGGVVVFIAFRVAEFPSNDAVRQAALWPYHLCNLAVFTARIPSHRDQIPRVRRA